jgi:capsular exopolysaccharide synthesis family protein
MFRSRQKKVPEVPDEANRLLDEDVVVVIDRAVNPYLVLFHEPAGFRAEQIRALRNRLATMNPDGDAKTLVVTSAVRGEGKTVTALNLAMAFAELERQEVCVVDADLRRPSIERYLNLNSDLGLADILLGRTSLERVLRPVGFRKLMLLGAGSRVNNPAEVLSQDRIDELFARLKERFQYVVVDTPPVLPCTDAGVVASRADGTLLVLRLEQSHRGQSKDALRNLQDLGANVLGAFVSEVRGQDPESNPRFVYDREQES